ncbi:DUF3306 domain-containing protein [Donghicola sp. B5-SW-15]|uniref:DUF3306 domain-containing protein n=2 Tax=Donghicola mangrovi TaxID=2729614 RepID=A0A850QCL9_9RHOB|nr:DUF3306 domain-containing protein [Donghicola mangrovi]
MMGADFWSRRRAAVRAEAEAEVAEAARIAEVQAETLRAKTEAEKTDEELLVELGLPDPDSLQAGDDFTAFMSRAVPARLRNRALRKLWVSNPVLANLDGLVDHAEDYTDVATVMPDMKTAYQVGKGMLAHVQELARQAEALANPQLAPEPVAEEPAPQEAPEMIADAPEAEAPATPAFTDTPQDDGAQPMPRRHMRFVFADSH